MNTPSDMQGRVALITGAAAGLGKATALCLAKVGAALALVDIDQAGLEATAAVAREHGVEVLALPFDLAINGAAAQAVESALSHFGRLDALCNVAAVLIPCHTPEMTPADWDRTIAVNLTAPFQAIQAAIPSLIQHRGAVVNVSSCGAFVGQAYTVAYCATKAGINHMTKSLAMEYMHQPIRFNAVAPGGMMTTLAAGFRSLQAPDPTLAKRFAPLRGTVEIEDVAALVAFLATDAARGYHGAIISLDNGITAG